MIDFIAFPKIPRLNREWIITEKIDGTNAVVFVSDEGIVKAGSRSRWITPESDNYGFAKWVHENEDELRTGLGPGFHYGEWWGKGIQKRYGSFMNEKRFSLFNISRWTEDVRPSCCHVVPELTRGLGVDRLTAECVARLRELGSVAAPGCMNPGGVIAFHVPSGNIFKVLLENDAGHKG